MSLTFFFLCNLLILLYTNMQRQMGIFIQNLKQTLNQSTFIHQREILHHIYVFYDFTVNNNCSTHCDYQYITLVEPDGDDDAIGPVWKLPIDDGRVSTDISSHGWVNGSRHCGSFEETVLQTLFMKKLFEPTSAAMGQSIGSGAVIHSEKTP